MSSKDAFSLVAAMAELEEIERYFATSAPELDMAVKKHARAAELGKSIIAHLDTAQSAIEAVDLAQVASQQAEE